jgi:DNA-binding LacI/PurR family transcriptional regulator
VTLKQIAARAGCSVTAVSKTLNGARGTASVGEATRQRVLAIAEELGYRPNYLARALQSGRTHTLGLVVASPRAGSLQHESWSPLLAGVQQCTRGMGHDVLLVGPDNRDDEVERGLRHLAERRIDALLVHTGADSERVARLAEAEGAIVLAGSTVPGPHPAVGTDLGPGLREVCDCLASLGHRRLVWTPLTADGELVDAERDAAVMAAAAAVGLDLEVLSVELRTPLDLDNGQLVETAREQFSAALEALADHTAVLAHTERAALGLYAALRDAGRRVPEDMSVVGIDDIHADAATPALCAVSTELQAVGARAAQLALALAGDETDLGEGYVELLPSRLVMRRSIAPPPC